MRARLPGFLRWFAPGMRVKRWVILAVASIALVVFGTLPLLGLDLLRAIYSASRLPEPYHLLIVGASFLLGTAGFATSLAQLVRSVARGVAPQAVEKTSTLIYRTRLLQRGPHVVAIGGGTGLSSLLRGLKTETSNITAVVTVMDDGGSSGRLREAIDVLPPGDVRNCLLALAEDETQLSRYFQHRFVAPAELAGHALGNLLLTGLEQATGGFDLAIEAMSHFLRIEGRVLPATLTKAHLVALLQDGDRIEGETRITADPRTIRRIILSTSPVPAYEPVLRAIAEADLIVLGPGSLYTSIVPNLLVDGLSAAIENAAAEKLLVANLMTQPGETTGFTLSNHLHVLTEYVDVRRFDLLLVNSAVPDPRMLAGYREEAAEPVVDDVEDANDYALTVVRTNLVGTAKWAGKLTIKHDPKKLARAITRNTQAFLHPRRMAN